MGHSFSVFFFFQAEDGIRDVAVTGVQTCALPISFRRDRYHSPTVVWGRVVNALLAGLARQLPAGDVGAQHAAPLRDAVHRITDAVDHSGLRHAELWSYAIENGQLVPSRYEIGRASCRERV